MRVLRLRDTLSNINHMQKNFFATALLCVIAFGFLGAQAPVLQFVQVAAGQPLAAEKLEKACPALGKLVVVFNSDSSLQLAGLWAPAAAATKWAVSAKNVCGCAAGAFVNKKIVPAAGTIASTPAFATTEVSPATYGDQLSSLAQAAAKLHPPVTRPATRAEWEKFKENTYLTRSYNERTSLWRRDSLRHAGVETARELPAGMFGVYVWGQGWGVVPVIPADEPDGAMTGWTATLDRTPAAITAAANGLTAKGGYYVRFARFENLTHELKSPPVEGLVEVFVDAVTPSGMEGAFYYLKRYESREQAIAAAAAFSAVGRTSEYDRDFDGGSTGFTLVSVVKMPPTR